MFGEKNLGKCTPYIGITVMPRLCPVFYLHQFQTNATNNFSKNYLNLELKMTDSGGLMLCAGGQALMIWFKLNSVLWFMYWAIIYSIKVTDGKTKWMCRICWKLTIKTPEQSHWPHSGIFILNSKHISCYALVFLVFLLLTLNKKNLG